MTAIAPLPPLVTAIRLAKKQLNLSWNDIANAIGKPPTWTVAALYGQHPLSDDEAATVTDLLELPTGSLDELTLAPYRCSLDIDSDPTVYRFQEALQVYGPALKELISEEFGDGIMSAINFTVDIKRRTHDDGDRVVVTFDGKFLDYRWTQ